LSTLGASTPHLSDGFVHQALLYTGESGFVDGTLPFIQAALTRKEPILVAVGVPKIDRLRSRLRDAAEAVHWIDMAGIGGNPARIIPLWTHFAARHGDGGLVWGIGEPIWAGRTAAELVESQRHEALLNVAFAGGPALRLLCPYDTAALDSAVIAEAHRSHPLIVDGGSEWPSTDYLGTKASAAPFESPLPEPVGEVQVIALADVSPLAIWRFVAHQASDAGLGSSQTDDMVVSVVAASESLAQGGDHGTLRIWRDLEALICEVRYPGQLGDPMAGRKWPSSGDQGGGLWVANQLCDLVELRSFRTGAVARLRMVA
jgi:DcmR-like sensory protein